MSEGKKVGYGRVSTDDQSLDVQMEQLREAGCTKIFAEKISGAVERRPQLDALLDYVREDDAVVVCKLDRIARNTSHLLDIVDQLDKKQVAFRVLNINLDTGTPTGRLMLTMLGAIGEFERGLMLERQRDGVRLAKAKGIYKGRVPTARRRMSEILELSAQGMSRQAIADRLGMNVSSVFRLIKDYRAGEIAPTGAKIAAAPD
jgi:DNA invertase Pin-like site-specific DNA recombinase